MQQDVNVKGKMVSIFKQSRKFKNQKLKRPSVPTPWHSLQKLLLESPRLDLFVSFTGFSRGKMLLFVAYWIFYIASVEVLASTQQTRILRKIGGYERMLTRVAPESSKLSLSHGSLFILKGKVSDELLLKSLQLLLKRYLSS